MTEGRIRLQILHSASGFVQDDKIGFVQNDRRVFRMTGEGGQMS